MSENGKRAVIYCRVSTEEQAEKYGLPAQLRACRELAKQHGLTIVEEIPDGGFSGAVLERPGLNKLRAMVREGAADVVLMMDSDRLSRNLADLLILKLEIERKARLEFVTGRFEKTPLGEMFFKLKGVIGEYEREQIRERTRRGMKERLRSGLLPGGRQPYGYRYEAGKYIIHPEQAQAVSNMFQWIDAGDSVRSIALRLRQLVVPTYTGKPWNHASVRCMLKNEVYAGVARYHGLEPIPVPAIVDRQLWLRVQARLASNIRNGRPSSNYLLRGLLTCPHCGRKLAGERSHQYRAYRCNGRDALRGGLPGCRRSISAAKLDEAAWTAVTRMFGSAEFLRSALAEHRAALEPGEPRRVDELAALAKKLRAREQNALGMLMDPDLADNRAAIKAAYVENHRELARVEAELGSWESAPEPDADWLEETVRLLSDHIAELASPEERQEFLRGLVQRAQWDGSELRLTCAVGTKGETSAARYRTQAHRSPAHSPGPCRSGSPPPPPPPNS